VNHSPNQLARGTEGLSSDTTVPRAPGRTIGRYTLFDPIAVGGMATVHLGILNGQAGFTRTVAIKRLHAEYAADPEFVCMFIDEGRMAARILHANVVQTLDVAAVAGELFLIMEYVQGESLSKLLRFSRARGERIPWKLACTIMAGVLHGIHAAHEATNQRGEPLCIIHRDVSPQNVLVGIDGVPRVLDFGIAKAFGRLQTTRQGQIKGKIAYMAPEQIEGTATRQSDIYAASAVLWEALTNRRLFEGDTDSVVLAKVLEGRIVPPSSTFSELPADLDAIVMQGLEQDPSRRFANAMEMARRLDTFVTPSSSVAEWVERVAHETLARRKRLVLEVEGDAHSPALGFDATASLISPVSGRDAPGAVTNIAIETYPPSEDDVTVRSSVTNTSSPRPTRSTIQLWRRPAFVAICTGALLIGTIAAIQRSQSGRQSNTLASASPVSEPTRTAVLEEPIVEPPVPSGSLARPMPDSAPSSIPRAAGSARRISPSKPPRPRNPKPDCNPPYRVTPDGLREYKPQCL
jgi:serine/threonine protein kinase